MSDRGLALGFGTPRNGAGPAAFIVRSLDVLRAEQPDAHARMCDALARQRVRIGIDEDELLLIFADGSAPENPRVGRPSPTDPATVEVLTSRQTILALTAGHHTLTSATLADAMVLRGNLDALLAFHDGLMFYLHGAVRSPGFPPLLDAFRTGAADIPVLRFGSHS